MTVRALLPDFNEANPLYTGATVTVYQSDAAGVATATLATLYDAITGGGTLSNPLTLDGDGKWITPPYAAVPVILSITGASVADHATGVAGPPTPEVGDPTAWTPVLKFGGATTGISYSTSGGTYTTVGSLVFFSGFIILTSKGSATGAATITGLPSLPSAQGNFNVNISYSANFNTVTGLPFMVLKSNSSDGHMNIYAATTNGDTETTSLVDTNFSNVTNLYFNGWYRKAA
jgi:hypothetical protein